MNEELLNYGTMTPASSDGDSNLMIRSYCGRLIELYHGNASATVNAHRLQQIFLALPAEAIQDDVVLDALHSCYLQGQLDGVAGATRDIKAKHGSGAGGGL